MRKSIVLISLIVSVLFSFATSSIAGEIVQRGPLYIGQFSFGEANWNDHLELQLLRILDGTPEKISVKVIGRTNEIGPERINIPLAKKRADIVAERIMKIKPNATVDSRGEIFQPKNGHNVNYKMVEVRISYQEDSMPSNLDEDIVAINSSLNEFKNTQLRILSELARLDNSAGLSELKVVLESLEQEMTDRIKNNQAELQARKVSLDETFSSLSLSMRQLKDSLGKLEQGTNQDLDMSQSAMEMQVNNMTEIINASNALAEELKETLVGYINEVSAQSDASLASWSQNIERQISLSNESIDSLRKELEKKKKYLDSASKRWLFVAFGIQSLAIIVFTLLLSRKKKTE